MTVTRRRHLDPQILNYKDHCVRHKALSAHLTSPHLTSPSTTQQLDSRVDTHWLWSRCRRRRFSKVFARFAFAFLVNHERTQSSNNSLYAIAQVMFVTFIFF